MAIKVDSWIGKYISVSQPWVDEREGYGTNKLEKIKGEYEQDDYRLISTVNVIAELLVFLAVNRRPFQRHIVSQAAVY